MQDHLKCSTAIFALVIFSFFCHSVNSQRNFYSSCGRRLRTSVDNRNANAPKPLDGENVAKREDFPWQVSIFQRSTPQSSFAYRCGGTLIAPLGNANEILVATAAHCVTKDKSEDIVDYDTLRVILGPSNGNMNGNSDFTGSQKHYVKHIELNPNYQPVGLKSDIALIQLRDKVRLTSYAQPACFPASKTELLKLAPGTIGQVAGFGWDTHRNLSSVLRTAEMRVFATGICQDVFKTKVNGFLQFCAGDQYESTICQSDSGSGLILEHPKDSGQYFLQGILSLTEKDNLVFQSEGICLNYNLFTLITPFVEWTQQVQERLIKEAKPTVSPPKKAFATGPPGASVDSTFILSPSEYMKVALDLHNHYRRRHSSPAVQLNEQMHLEAQALAETLIAHNTLEEPRGSEYSTNLFAIPGALAPADAVREAMQFWYRASVNYDKEEPKPSAFTQLVWKSSNQIGTGVATNGRRTVVVVYYWPKGNQYYTGGRKSERTKLFYENVKLAGKGF